MNETVLESYRRLVREGRLDHDPAQLRAVEELHLLARRLESHERSGASWFSSLARRRPEPPKGLYMFGGVGRGKTMLMDLFHSRVPVASKQRWHFHAFMRDVHERIRVRRSTSNGDPLAFVGAQIAERGRLLCLDEFQVTDITDAMLLGRLFEALLDNDAVMVATSNTAPRDLYENGLNRQLFLPFIERLEASLEVLELDSPTDYRLRKLASAPRYFNPLGARTSAQLRQAWQGLTGVERGAPEVLKVAGRDVVVPEAHDGVAFMQFADLFEKPLGAGDYLAMAARYHTIILDGVPRLGPERRNEARRLITFVDALYDNGVRLVVGADGEPDELYQAGDGADAFARTSSRLIEMRSDSYLETERRAGRVS
ncbi:MAG: cell division protein ZapE [Rhizobiales bacterium]|nr:cell division protein ZapE [Hyphomicrobiales bacterium]